MNTRRSHSAAWFAGAVLALALPADIAPAQGSSTVAVSDEIAAEARKAFLAAFRDKDDMVRLAALEHLGNMRHRLIAQSYAVAMDDAAPRVRAAAATGLGYQEAKDAYPALQRAWTESRNESAAEVMVAIAEAFRGIGKCPPLKELTRRFDTLPKEVGREIIKASALIRDVETVKWLGTLLDQPAPENVNSPTNPPAEYWAAKVEAWNFWVREVHDVLKDLTGKDFEDKKQIEEWKSKGGKIVPLKKRS